MKKLIAIVIALTMLLCFAACSKNNAPADEGKTDLEYVKDKGVLVVGITDFEPMDYQDKNGEWIGFDADVAKLFAESLGVKVEFVEIDWDNKIMELDGKTIDCIWNGMTLTDEVTAAASCSNPYFNNKQVVIVPAKNADSYKTAADCKELNFAVEAGSAGEAVANDNGFKVTPVKDQASALMEVKSGTADAAIIDLLMAMAMTGEGTSYADLTYTAGLNDEKYGVAFRTGSDLVDSLNAFFVSNYADIEKVAETYGLTDALIEQK